MNLSRARLAQVRNPPPTGRSRKHWTVPCSIFNSCGALQLAVFGLGVFREVSSGCSGARQPGEIPEVTSAADRAGATSRTTALASWYIGSDGIGTKPRSSSRMGLAHPLLTSYVVMRDATAELLFQVIAGRAGQAAVIATTNRPFSEWSTNIPNARLCKAMLGRLTDRAHIIDTGTESNRFLRTMAWQGGKTGIPMDLSLSEDWKP